MAYGYYASVTVDNTKVSGSANLTNFPILVSGTYDGTGGEPDIRTTGNGGNIENTASGGASGSYTVPADLVFSPNTDGSSPYDFEIEKYDASTGEIVAWVEITTLDYNDDTVLYMVYGDSGVSTSQEDVAGTWGAYTGGVYHLAGSYDGTANEVKDSSGSDDGAGVAGKVPVQTTGKAGFGQDFQSNADIINLGDVTTYDGGADLSVEFWVNQDTLTANESYVRKWDGGAFAFFTALGTGDDEIRMGIAQSVSTNRVAYETSGLNMTTGGGWYHVTAVWQGTTNFAFYVNSTTPGTSFVSSAGSAPTSIANSTEELGIGGRMNTNGSPDLMCDAQIDEVRLTTTELTADWAYTNHANQNSPSTFYTMGSETSVGAATATPQMALTGVGL